MYKVFINEKPLLITHQPVSIAGLQTVFNPTLDDIKQLLQVVKTGGNGINIVCDTPEYTFGLLKSLHTLIDAAGGLVKNKDGKYLFIKRNGFWDLPKGKVDDDEPLEVAAVREVMEECGIDGLIITGFATNTYHTYPYKTGEALKITHWYFMDTDFYGELIPQAEEGITETVWFTLDEVRNTVLPNTFKSIYDLINETILKP